MRKYFCHLRYGTSYCHVPFTYQHDTFSSFYLPELKCDWTVKTYTTCTLHKNNHWFSHFWFLFESVHWFWMWLPHRWMKCQSQPTTVLSTTQTQTVNQLQTSVTTNNVQSICTPNWTINQPQQEFSNRAESYSLKILWKFDYRTYDYESVFSLLHPHRFLPRLSMKAETRLAWFRCFR